MSGINSSLARKYAMALSGLDPDQLLWDWSTWGRPDQLAPEFVDPFSIGIDLETGGHVFQLLFTNAVGMVADAAITETVGKWTNGDIRFGFNISRVFTIVDPQKEKVKKEKEKG